LFALFHLVPLAWTLILSFQRTFGPDYRVFVGLDNYRFLAIDSLFWWALLNTLVFALCFVGLLVPLALGLALMLNSPRLPGRTVLRTAFFSTHMVGSVFVAVLFAALLSPKDGLVNRFLGQISGRVVEIRWLSEPELAMPAVLLAALWISVGFAMVLILAALQGIDPALLDAAAVDGAGPVRRFIHVTLPALRPILLFVTVVSTIGAVQLFELPYILFEQSAGPGQRALTVVMYLFLTAFGTGDLGYAASIGVVLAVLTMVLAAVQLRLGAFGRDLA
jgi:ABC-type sugar transport system permease subunit